MSHQRHTELMNHAYYDLSHIDQHLPYRMWSLYHEIAQVHSQGYSHFGHKDRLCMLLLAQKVLGCWWIEAHYSAGGRSPQLVPTITQRSTPIRLGVEPQVVALIPVCTGPVDPWRAYGVALRQDALTPHQATRAGSSKTACPGRGLDCQPSTGSDIQGFNTTGPGDALVIVSTIVTKMLDQAKAIKRSHITQE